MKNYEIFKAENWQFMKFDGRKKIFRGVDRAAFDAAKERSVKRLIWKYIPEVDQRCESLKAIDFCKLGRGTSYAKCLMPGGEYIWFTSPCFGIDDYNKAIFAPNTERNRRKAALINALAAK